MTKNDMARVLNAAYATFPHLTLTPHAIAQWFTLFGACDAATFSAALNQAVKSSNARFFPVPGEVNQIIFKRSETPAPLGVEVWEACVELAQRGRGLSDAQKVFADNDRALKAIRAVGWDRIRYADLETELPFIRKDFVSYYDRMVDHDNELKMLMTDEHATALLENFDVKIKTIGCGN